MEFPIIYYYLIIIRIHNVYCWRSKWQRHKGKENLKVGASSKVTDKEVEKKRRFKEEQQDFDVETWKMVIKYLKAEENRKCERCGKSAEDLLTPSVDLSEK